MLSADTIQRLHSVVIHRVHKTILVYNNEEQKRLISKFRKYELYNSYFFWHKESGYNTLFSKKSWEIDPVYHNVYVYVIL
jgi:hypothetical protein